MPNTKLNFELMLEHHRKTAFARDWPIPTHPMLYAQANQTCRTFVGATKINLDGITKQNAPTVPTERVLKISRLLQLCYGKNRTGTPTLGGRVLPSGGGFYPNELYCVFPRDNAFFKSGFIAHYFAHNHTLEVLAMLNPDEQNSAVNDITFVFTTTPLKSFKKYRHRSWRFAQIDLGHLLASTKLVAEDVGYQLNPANNCSLSVFAESLRFSRPEFSGEHIAFMLTLKEPTTPKAASPLFTVTPHISPVQPNTELRSHISIGEITSLSEKFFTKHTVLDSSWFTNEPTNCSDLRGHLPHLQSQRKSPERFYKLKSEDEPLIETLISKFESFPYWQNVNPTSPTRPQAQHTALPLVLPIIVTNGLKNFADGIYLFASPQLAQTLASVIPINNNQYLQTNFENLRAYLLKPFSAPEFQDLLKMDWYYEASALVLLFGNFSVLKTQPENYASLLWRCGIFGQYLTLVANKIGLSARGYGGGSDDYLNIDLLQQNAGPYRHLISYAVGQG